MRRKRQKSGESGESLQRQQPKKVPSKNKKHLVKKITRTKSKGTILEKAFRKGRNFCSVICRLASICSDSILVEEIKRTARAMKQIQMETWHLVNLHTLRCLEKNLPLPDFGSTFFDHCCSGVSSTAKTQLIADKYPSLWESIEIYRTSREYAGLDEVSNLTGYSELKKDMRRTMVTNAGTMIREHFRKRLRVYVEITFGGNKSKRSKKEKKARQDRLRKIVQACYNVDETDLLEALQTRDVLTPDGVEWSEKWIPWPNHIKGNGLAFYVRLIWEFQSAVEARMEKVPNEKGVRAFTLLPVSTTYTNAHITINGTTLAGFYSRVPANQWTGPNMNLSAASFQQNRWTAMRHAFDIERFETRKPECPLTKAEFARLSVEEKYEHASHLFANQVTTDGYGATVLLTRPKKEVERSEQSQNESVVPPGYVPNVVIGLDPGMRSICTAVREDLRSDEQRHIQRQRRRRRHRQRKRGSKRRKCNRPRWIRRPKPPRHRNERDVVSVTTREYRHMAGFNRFRAWHEGQKRSHPEYSKVIATMPSFKTASYKKYLGRLEYFWCHAQFLLQFSVDRPFLKWKFFRKRMAQIAVDAVAKRIVPHVSRLTCVAYGDWSRREGIKGHAPSPVKGLKQALQKRATVVSMDEFKTSKLCLQCHQTLSQVAYVVDVMLPKKRKRKGVVLTRNRAEVQFEEKTCYGVLCCDHKNCTAQYWDRDVNAAINMVELLKSEILGRGRMPAFRRA